MTIRFEYSEDYCEFTVELVYKSMLDPTINSGNMEGLTHEEVKDILIKSNRPICKVFNDDCYVGYANPGDVTSDLYKRIGLDENIKYKRLGVLFIHEDYRQQGIGTKVIEQFCKENDNVLYLVDATNVASNKVARKTLEFKQTWWNGWRMKTFNVYHKTI